MELRESKALWKKLLHISRRRRTDSQDVVCADKICKRFSVL